MKNIIPKDSRYIPFTQQKSCCVPACISIIMYKLGIPLVSQELLGYHLGLMVAPKNKKLFWNMRTGKRPKAGYGTKIAQKRYEPNTVFKKLGIPLKLTVNHIDKFKTKKELVSFISDRVKQDKNIIVCFNHGVLSGDKTKKGGHVCVIDRIYIKKNKIRLIDPSPNRPKWREVSLDILKKAMELHPAQGGGIWELKKK